MCVRKRSRACSVCLCPYVELHRLHLCLRPSTYILVACTNVYAGLASREQDAVAAMAKAASTLASPASHPRPRKPRSGAARETSGGKPRAADKGDQGLVTSDE